jgi:hypothetical protein
MRCPNIEVGFVEIDAVKEICNLVYLQDEELYDQSEMVIESSSSSSRSFGSRSSFSSSSNLSGYSSDSMMLSESGNISSDAEESSEVEESAEGNSRKRCASLKSICVKYLAGSVAEAFANGVFDKLSELILNHDEKQPALFNVLQLFVQSKSDCMLVVKSLGLQRILDYSGRGLICLGSLDDEFKVKGAHSQRTTAQRNSAMFAENTRFISLETRAVVPDLRKSIAKHWLVSSRKAALRVEGASLTRPPFFVAVERAKYGSLASLIKNRTLKKEKRFRIAHSIAKAIANIHSLEVAHGALSAENIYVCSGDRAKVDFGNRMALVRVLTIQGSSANLARKISMNQRFAVTSMRLD